MWQKKHTTKLENSDFKIDRRKKNNTPLKNSNHIIPRNYNSKHRSKAKYHLWLTDPNAQCTKIVI
jgi:hypothetical protein